MSYFIFVIFHLFLLTEINSSPINEEVIRLEKSPNDFGSIGRILTWKFQVDQSSFDSNRIYQEIQLALYQLESDTDLSFRQVTDDEKADIEVTLLAGNHSHGILLDGSLESYTAYIRINSIEAWTDTFNDIAEHLRIKLTNAIVSSDDDDDETSMNDIQRSSRIARSARHKKKNKKNKLKKSKSKNKKKKYKKMKKVSELNNSTLEDVSTVQEQLPITFQKNDSNRVENVIKTRQDFTVLQAFKNLSTIINNATGTLPQKSIPHLQKLSVAYAKTTQIIRVGFADACAVLSKFVIKSWHILRRGMNQQDKDFLINLKNQLNIDFTNASSEFIEISRSSLMNIYSELFIEKGGQQAKNLLSKIQNLEIQLEAASKELTNITSRLGAVNGDIESLKYRKQFYDKATQDLKSARLELQGKLQGLKQQIPHYEQMVEKHRDTYKTVVRRRLLFFWKRETIRIDNGERIAKENLARLHERIREVETSLKTQSTADLIKERNKILYILNSKVKQQKILKSNYAPIELRYEQIDREFNNTVKELDQISHSNELTQNQVTESVDQMSGILQAASNTIISVCNKLNTSLEKLDRFPSSLVEAISDAIQFIYMADQYSDSMVLDNIKRILSL